MYKITAVAAVFLPLFSCNTIENSSGNHSPLPAPDRGVGVPGVDGGVPDQYRGTADLRPVAPPRITLLEVVEVPTFANTYTTVRWAAEGDGLITIVLNGQPGFANPGSTSLKLAATTTIKLVASNAGGSVEKELTIPVYPLYSTVPDLPSCKEGELSAEAKQATVAYMNSIRQALQLPPISYDSTRDPSTQKAALMMSANNQLNHDPPLTWNCYSTPGHDGAASSNLALRGGGPPPITPYSPQEVLRQMLFDGGVPSLGHRRWLLNPFMPSLSIGIVDDGPTPFTKDYGNTDSAVWVLNTSRPDLPTYSLDFVAYPRGEMKYSLINGGYYSFSVLIDKTNLYNNGASNISFASATVSMAEKTSGAAVATSSVTADYVGYGLPNCLKWLSGSIKRDTPYTVTISNVMVKGASRSYSYEFILR